MHAIFEDGGRQYRVKSGDVLLVDRRDLEEGQTEIRFDNVLMVGEGAEAKIGTPWVDGASVAAKIVNDEMKMPKIEGLKFGRRKGYRRKWGHRQRMMRIQISAING